MKLLPSAVGVAASETEAGRTSDAPSLAPAAKSRKMDGSPGVCMSSVLEQQSSQFWRTVQDSLEYASAAAAMTNQLSGVRWIYEAILVREDFERVNADGEAKKGIPSPPHQVRLYGYGVSPCPSEWFSGSLS